MMKKFFSIVAIAALCVSSVFAGSKYSVEVNLSTKQVTIILDDKVVRGTKNNTSALATVKLEKNGTDKMYCTLESIKECPIPGLDPCLISSDGIVSFYGINYKDAAIKGAFREAMSYLKKTDEPIKMQIFLGE